MQDDGIIRQILICQNKNSKWVNQKQQPKRMY